MSDHGIKIWNAAGVLKLDNFSNNPRFVIGGAVTVPPSITYDPVTETTSTTPTYVDCPGMILDDSWFIMQAGSGVTGGSAYLVQVYADTDRVAFMNSSQSTISMDYWVFRV